MYRSFAVAIGAAIVLGGCATPSGPKAAQAAPAKPAATASAADPQNPKICAQVETTGSRFAVKECHTASEWAAIRAAGNSDLVNRTQRGFSAAGGN